MKTSSLASSLAAFFLGAVITPVIAVETPESAALIANDRAFEAAYAKADVKALAELFAEDAVYTSDDGRTFTGRAAIRDVIQGSFQESKGSNLTIRADSFRTISPDVVIEKGSSSVMTKSGDLVEVLFTTVHVKKDGEWKISELVETPMQDITPGERLEELAWLAGNWEEADEATDLTVQSRYSWARGGAFITRNVTVKRADDSVLEGWQIIGWDPVAETIRSWTFDGAGGYSEGGWSREGQRWLIREKGYSGDGGRTTAEQTITKANDNLFYWESGNRTLDGDPLPGIGRIGIHRVKGE